MFEFATLDVDGNKHIDESEAPSTARAFGLVWASLAVVLASSFKVCLHPHLVALCACACVPL